MRKQTKIAALVSAAALLAIGASLTAVAATPGWDENGIYLDRDGNPEEGWHKWSQNGQYYYSDADGKTVINAFVSKNGGVDDVSYPLYYVGPDGTRVQDMWIAVYNDEDRSFGFDDFEVIPTYLYRYMSGPTAVMNSNGSMKKASVPKNTNSTEKADFFFDGDGIMQEGEVITLDGTTEKEYYCVTEDDLADNVILVEKDNTVMSIKDAGYVEGQVMTGWVHFPWDDDEANLDELESRWRYYDGGVRLQNTVANLSWAGKKSNFYFEDGLCVVKEGVKAAYGKYTMSNATPATATTLNYLVSETGGILADSTGWCSVDADNDGHLEWYYMVSVRDANLKRIRNVIFNGEAGNTEWRALNINKKVYLFDNTGKMVDGEYTVDTTKFTDEPWYGIQCYDLAEGKTTAEERTYFFNDQENSGHRGEMMTGKVTYYDSSRDDNVTRYYDPKKGLMKNAIIGDYVYDKNGDLLTALETRELVPLGKKGSDNTYSIYKAVGSGKNLGAASAVGAYAPADKDGYLIIDTKGKALKHKSVVTVDGELKFTVDDNYVATLKKD